MFMGIALGPSSWVHSQFIGYLGTDKAYEFVIFSKVVSNFFPVDLEPCNVMPKLLRGGILIGLSLVMGCVFIFSRCETIVFIYFSLCDSGCHRVERETSLEGCVQVFPRLKGYMYYLDPILDCD